MGKEFPHAAHRQLIARPAVELQGRPFDPHRYRALFPDLWGDFLRRHYRGVMDVAYHFNVTERMARNWLEGANKPSGDKVALAALRHPAEFTEHFGKAA